MKFKCLAALLGIAGTLVFVRPVQAVPAFVGSYAVFSGPSWVTNPLCYTGQEAAALIFGGDADDYLISVNPSLDPTTITDTAWADQWGIHTGDLVAQNYKLQTGTGYNDPFGGPSTSAYVRDGLSDTGRFRNYVWKNDAPDLPTDGDHGQEDLPSGVAPEPSGLALLGLGLPLFGLTRRRKIS